MDKKDKDPQNYYTQREWDRAVGYGKVPDEYALSKYLENYEKNKEPEAEK
jgi:hypothetical protein